MLTDLGELDGGHDGVPIGSRRETRPGIHRLVPALEPAQHEGRSKAILSGVQELAKVDDRIGRPASIGAGRGPPKSAATRGDHHGSSSLAPVALGGSRRTVGGGGSAGPAMATS
jgi:hypothetical protein